MEFTITTAIRSNQPFKRKAHIDHPTLGTRWLCTCPRTGKVKYLRSDKTFPEFWEPTANDLVAADYVLLDKPLVKMSVLNEVLGRHLSVDDKRFAIEELLTRLN